MIFSKQVRIHLVLLLALTLSIIPLPSLLQGFRPPLVLLVVLYVQFFLTPLFNIVSLVLVGLCLDVLFSTMLGEHVFALVLTTWLASYRVRRFHIFPLGQQMALMALFCFIYQMTLYLIDTYQGFSSTLIQVIGVTFISLILWPWMMVWLERYFGRAIS